MGWRLLAYGRGSWVTGLEAMAIRIILHGRCFNRPRIAMRVLVACEFSGRVRDAFLRRGHDAWSCDLLPTEAPGPHIQGDVTPILREPWDLVIAHPECTYITNSGVKLLDNRKVAAHVLTGPARWRALFAACEFFKLCLNANAKSICVENPIPHKYGSGWIGTRYTQLIQPWMFGVRETKATCLWLKNLPKLKPTQVVGPPPKGMSPEERRAWNRVHFASPGANRWAERSRTPLEIADAMAAQWGIC